MPFPREVAIDADADASDATDCRIIFGSTPSLRTATSQRHDSPSPLDTSPVDTASCGNRPVRPRRGQAIEGTRLMTVELGNGRNRLILLSLRRWLLGLDSNQQP